MRHRRQETGDRRQKHLLSNDLYEDALLPLAIELAVEDLLPRSEVELAIRDGDDDLASHDRTFEMGVGVVLAGIVAILGDRFMRGELLKPDIEVLVQATFIVVDEDRCRDVHGVRKDDAFLDAAFPKAVLDLGGDVDEAPSAGDIEPELFTVGSH
jgi:hypothetical protein